MTAFWDTVLCSIVEVSRRLRDAYYLNHVPDDGGSKRHRKVGILQLHGAIFQKAAP